MYNLFANKLIYFKKIMGNKLQTVIINFGTVTSLALDGPGSPVTCHQEQNTLSSETESNN